MALHHNRSRRRCQSSGGIASQVLLSFLALSGVSSAARLDTPLANAGPIGPGPVLPLPDPDSAPPSSEHSFSLRHVFHHGTHQNPQLHRRVDIVQTEGPIWLAQENGSPTTDILPPLKARGQSVKIERLVDRRPSVVDPMVAHSREMGFVSAMSPEDWTLDDVPGPDIADKNTVISLAYMAANAYVEDEDKNKWVDVGVPFNRTADFGWESDGLRGHIFADDTNSTVVIGLKGTSMAVFDGEETTTNDKVNDNLFFSCCCGQQGQWTWRQVCDCATGTFSCNNTCVRKALREENRYYQSALELYSNVTELYPDANIWLSGHSLGGAVSSLLGLTYGLPVVTFEAVPEAMAAGRLGLPIPPGVDAQSPLHQTREYTGAYHFGHTADPVYIGTCNGATATCSFAGYAMESMCHTGLECTYDVVVDKGWRVGIGNHRIQTVIKDVLEAYDELAECKYTPECRDCANWKMYESNNTETTTSLSSTSTSKTRTRTTTCQTPGWWGCLDKTTTHTGTVTTTSDVKTTSTSTSTCETPGWFGCKDKTTTTTTTTTTTSSTPNAPTATSTCETPGRFWGCLDKTSVSSAVPATTPPPITPAPTMPASTTAAPSPTSSKCVHRNWFGFCKKWGQVDVDEL